MLESPIHALKQSPAMLQKGQSSAKLRPSLFRNRNRTGRSKHSWLMAYILVAVSLSLPCIAPQARSRPFRGFLVFKTVASVST
jgi:hypothetical protein